jgi:uncharacterized membrane protein YesL
VPEVCYLTFPRRNKNEREQGVPENPPPKKRFARFVELVRRDAADLIKLNFIYQLCLLPAQLAFLAIFSSANLANIRFTATLAAFCLLCSAPAGPAACSFCFCLTKMLRDEPGFLWHDFRHVFKENFRRLLLPGLVYCAASGAQFLACVYYEPALVGFIYAIPYFLAATVFNMSATYFFVQASYLELGVLDLAKNSLLLSLGYLPRSFMGALFWAATFAVELFAFPYSLPVLLAFGYSVPALLSLLWQWPIIDDAFKISETLKARENTAG